MGTLCAGCLASDRILRPLLNEVHKLGLNLFQKRTPQTQKKQIKEIDLCWECHNMMLNIYKFQQRVKNAQRVLKKKKIDISQVECLSTLSAVTQVDSFDYILYESTLVKQEDESNVPNINYYIEHKNELGDDKLELVGHKYELNENDLSDSKYNEVPIDKIKKVEDEPSGTEDVKQEYENSDYENSFEFETKYDSVTINKSADGETSSKPKGQIFNFVAACRSAYEIVPIADIIVPPVRGVNRFRSKYKPILIDQKEVKELTKSLTKLSKQRVECECGAGFCNEEVLEKHRLKFHSEKSGKYICDICKKRMKTLKKLSTHLREHFLKFQCEICQKICYLRRKMMKHLETHTKVLKCIFCKVTFSYKHEFKKHYQDEHAIQHCDSCNFKTPIKKLMHKHVVEHHKFRGHYKERVTKLVCDYCGLKTAKKDYLGRHIRYNHMEQKCKECNVVFKKRYYLQRHISIRHTSSAPEDSYCVTCDIQFKNKALLTRHYQSNTRHTPENKKKRRLIPCPDCDKVYTKKSYMTNHYNHVHLKCTKHKCEHCSMYFLTSTHLKNHIIWSHGIGEHKKDKLCPYCGRGFYSNQILTKHIRTHTGERPYGCNYCAATFAQSTACHTHMKKLHNWDKSLVNKN